MSTEDLRYFFSYARTDSEFVLQVAKDLRAVGANLWLDQLDIVPGQRWDRAVEEALKTCKGLIVVLSPESLDSNNVMDEVSYALEEGKLVVPIVVRSSDIPFRLRRVQRIDFTANYDTGFSQLLRAMHLEQPLSPLEATAPEPPVVRDIPAPSEGKSMEWRGSEVEPVQRRPTVASPIIAPAKAKWPSVILTIVGWTIANFIAWFFFRRLGPYVGFPTGGAVGGLLTAWALKRMIPSIEWWQLLIIVVGWTIGWFFMALIPANNNYSSDSFIISCVIAGGVGGLLTGLAVRRTIRSIQWWQVLIVAVGWIIGNVWLTLRMLVFFDLSLRVIVDGSIMGAIGAGVTFWLLFLKIDK
jgi:hypothetical protein